MKSEVSLIPSPPHGFTSWLEVYDRMRLEPESHEIIWLYRDLEPETIKGHALAELDAARPSRAEFVHLSFYLRRNIFGSLTIKTSEEIIQKLTPLARP